MYPESRWNSCSAPSPCCYRAEEICASSSTSTSLRRERLGGGSVIMTYVRDDWRRIARWRTTRSPGLGAPLPCSAAA
jgi:hypothetical protein